MENGCWYYIAFRSIKSVLMFFKKKRTWIPPMWWVRASEWQLKCAHSFAEWLGRKTAGMPRARLRMWLVLLLIGMAGVNLVWVWRSYEHHSVRQVSAPVEIVPSRVVVRAPVPRPRVDLKRLLDSLRRDPVGARVFDSLMKARPGLRDTLVMLGDMD